MTSLSSVVSMLFWLQLTLLLGRLGKNELAAGTLSFVFCNVTGFSLISGLMTALDSLASQAYGSKRYALVGVILQRALFLSSLILIPVVVLWQFSEQLLLFLKQDPIVSVLAGQYTRWMSFGMVPAILNTAMQRYLASQSIATPAFVASLIALAVGSSTAYLSILYFKIGFLGAPLSAFVYHSTFAISLFLYIRIAKLHEQTWPGFSREAFHDLGAFLKLAGPGIVMICAEWWAFEILAIFAGWISVEALDAHSIVVQFASLSYMIPIGLSVAASSRVGNALGANNPDGAMLALKISFTTVVLIELVQSIVIFIFRRQLGGLFSDNTDVIDNVSATVPILCVMLISDGSNAVNNGILRGMARQNIGAGLNIGLYYLVGLPLAYVLAFPAKLTIMGLWIAITVSTWAQVLGIQCWEIVFFQALILLRFVHFKADWKEEAARAVERARLENEELEKEKIRTAAEEEKGEKIELIEERGKDKEKDEEELQVLHIGGSGKESGSASDKEDLEEVKLDLSED